MRKPDTQQEWLEQAALYELLALSFRLPVPELAEALSSGEFADALAEIGEANGLSAPVVEDAVAALHPYTGADPDALFHRLRTRYTALFVGAPEPLASPFAGIWWARAQGVEPLLFVNKRSMDVERYLRHVGIGQAEGKNEPLDHIATMLEFLHYVALILSGAVEQDGAGPGGEAASDGEPNGEVGEANPGGEPAPTASPASALAPADNPAPTTASAPPAAATTTVPAPASITPNTAERFIADYLADWLPQFTARVVEQADEPFYRAMVTLLAQTFMLAR
jgi:TorA maturation chaperone TorD